MLIDPNSKKHKCAPDSSLEKRGGVSVKSYRRLLSNAGMTHQTLTEKPIEIDEHENVSAQSLREAKKALDDKTKNDQNFIRFYINTTDDDVKIGVTKLREFLYAH